MMINQAWHRDNPVPIYPRTAFLGWHLRHEAACSCRPMPEMVLRELDALGVVMAGRIERMPVPGSVTECDPPATPSDLPHVIVVNGQ